MLKGSDLKWSWVLRVHFSKAKEGQPFIFSFSFFASLLYALTYLLWLTLILHLVFLFFSPFCSAIIIF